MDRVNLTGVSLQRAIAERKGWRDVHPDEVCEELCGRHDDNQEGVDLAWIDKWHNSVTAAHALLDELVADGWGYRFSRLGNIHSASAFHISKSKPPAEITTDTDFCTAVGNLYLECVG